jgi:hypothetical protein
MTDGKLRAEVISRVRTLNPLKRHREHCHEVRPQMTDYLEGELDPRVARIVKSLRRTVAGLRVLGDLPTPADEPHD